jgi:predicted Zn-dependent protease
MKRALGFLIPLALGVAVLSAPYRLPTTPGAATFRSIAAGMVGRLADSTPALRNADGEAADVRRRLLRDERGTYIGEILLERDSAVVRWPDGQPPLTVWVQPWSHVPDFQAAFVDSVQSAFRDWDQVGTPVHFRFVRDSADAQIHVHWIDHFDQPISGRTKWARDDSWQITEANIVLAVHHNEGLKLDVSSMKALALHEIGHVMGLDHTSDAMSIMAPRVRVRALADEDRATVRLLYELPVGPVPDAGR